MKYILRLQGTAHSEGLFAWIFIQLIQQM